MTGVLGIVLVTTDDDAGTGLVALAPLKGISLLRRAVGTLQRSGAVDRVCVLGPSSWGSELVDDLALLPRERRRQVDLVLGVEAGWAAVLPGVLERYGLTDDGALVLHDPGYPLAPSDLVRTVLARLAQDPSCAAAVPTVHVTDTVKRLDADDNVTATVDRERYRTVCTPVACRVGPLRATVEAAAQQGRGVGEPVALPGFLRGVGATVTAVATAGEVFRVVDAEDLVWVEAMVTVGTDVDEEAADAR